MTITMSYAHSPTFPSLHLRHNSFSNPSVTFPMSQLILQPFRCFTYVIALFQPFFRFYVTGCSLTSLGEPPMLKHFRPPLWSMGNIVTSHAAGPGSIPGHVSLLIEVFRGFPSTVRQMSGNLGHIRLPLSYGHHISSKSYIICLQMATVSDHSCST